MRATQGSLMKQFSGGFLAGKSISRNVETFGSACVMRRCWLELSVINQIIISWAREEAEAKKERLKLENYTKSPFSQVLGICFRY